MSLGFLKSNKLITLKSMNLLCKMYVFFFFRFGMDPCKNELNEHFLFLNFVRWHQIIKNKLKYYIYKHTKTMLSLNFI